MKNLTNQSSINKSTENQSRVRASFRLKVKSRLSMKTIGEIMSTEQLSYTGLIKITTTKNQILTQSV